MKIMKRINQKNYTIICLFLCIVVSCKETKQLTFCSQHHEQATNHDSIQVIAKTIFNNLSIEQRLGQMFFLYSSLQDYATIMQKIQPGGVFLQKSSIPKNTHGEQNILLLKKRIQKMQNRFKQAKLPIPFIAIDHELGKVQRITTGVSNFVSAMALSEALAKYKDPNLAKMMGYMMCRDLHRLGITMSFSPVVDLQTNMENQVIGTRSMGNDPVWVNQVASSYIHGIHLGGCVDTIKHFPGHGSVSNDSHLVLPIQSQTYQELMAHDLVPFRELIRAGLTDSVMVGHILVPKVDKRIASLSPIWIQNILRKKWHYAGIVITDDIGMRAVTPKLTQTNINHAIEQAFHAGIDMFLFSESSRPFAIKAKQYLLKQIKHQPSLIKRLNTSVRRILSSKISKLYQQKKMIHPLLSVRERIQYYFRYGIWDWSADKFTYHISRDAVKIIHGSYDNDHHLKPKHQIMYTDIHPQKDRIEYQLLTNKYSTILPLQFLLQKNSLVSKQPRIHILHTQDKFFKHKIALFLQKTNRPPVSIFSVLDPFPYTSLSRVLSAHDDLIIAFANNKFTKRILIDILIKETKIEKSLMSFTPNKVR